jgi:hypothetical protein
MEKKKRVIGSALSVAGVKLITINEVYLNHWRRGKAFSIIGFKAPLSVVVVTPAEKKAFRMDGEEVSLEELKLEVPDLEI